MSDVLKKDRISNFPSHVNFPETDISHISKEEGSEYLDSSCTDDFMSD